MTSALHAEGPQFDSGLEYFSAISLAAMIPRCQRGGPGSTPGWRTAVVAQLGERQTEDLKVPDSISGDGRLFFCNFVQQNYKKKVLPGFEPGLLDSKSRVITITL